MAARVLELSHSWRWLEELELRGDGLLCPDAMRTQSKRDAGDEDVGQWVNVDDSLLVAQLEVPFALRYLSEKTHRLSILERTSKSDVICRHDHRNDRTNRRDG